MNTSHPPAFATTLDYLRIEALLDLVDEPAGTVCHQIASAGRRRMAGSRAGADDA
jgi:hypothetical protein